MYISCAYALNLHPACTPLGTPSCQAAASCTGAAVPDPLPEPDVCHEASHGKGPDRHGSKAKRTEIIGTSVGAMTFIIAIRGATHMKRHNAYSWILNSINGHNLRMKRGQDKLMGGGKGEVVCECYLLWECPRPYEMMTGLSCIT